jgi:hypothetical protein
MKRINEGRIYDYSAFNDSKKPTNTNDYTFGIELGYTDIDIVNRPEEYADISDAKIFIDYSVNLVIKKSGIDSMDISVNSMELDFEVDDYPNESKEFDIDLIPGRTIDYNQILIEKKEVLIPTYPKSVSIDMSKSTEARNFKITVVFGS